MLLVEWQHPLAVEGRACMHRALALGCGGSACMHDALQPLAIQTSVVSTCNAH